MNFEALGNASKVLKKSKLLRADVIRMVVEASAEIHVFGAVPFVSAAAELGALEKDVKRKWFSNEFMEYSFMPAEDVRLFVLVGHPNVDYFQKLLEDTMHKAKSPAPKPETAVAQ